MDRDKIVKFCEEYLKVKDFQDYCVDGLQVEGSFEVKKIITGVSLSQKLIATAIEKKAQMIMVHHGIFGNQINKPPQIKGVVRNRLKLILANDLNLVGFHLPLDAHPEIGNNISICKLLGISENLQPFDVGFIGDLAEPMAWSDFVNLVNNKIGCQAYTLAVGPKTVKRVGVISGGASPDYKLAAELGADTYIAGDMREEVVWAATESAVNIINAGHYNTETFGIKNLGDLVAKEFKIEVEFVDIPCEI